MLEFTNVQDSQSANSSAAPAQNGAQFNAVTTSAPMAAAQAALRLWPCSHWQMMSILRSTAVYIKSASLSTSGK